MLASCANLATTNGVLIATENLLESTPLPPIISVSYGECEAFNGTVANQTWYALFQLAAAQGVSAFVASGDSLGGVCDRSVPAAHGLGVSGYASTPYDVAVGGTDFADTYLNNSASYWSTSNNAYYGSAASYVPEIPWNDSCASGLVTAYAGYATAYGPTGFCNSLGTSVNTTYLLQASGGSGGQSSCAVGVPATQGVVGGTCLGWAKPYWQAVAGNPADGVRDLPDVSLFAALGVAWSHCLSVCDSHSKACVSQTPSTWSCGGGTSFAAPIMAGIQALINQRMGGRQGNPNPVYYAIANAQYGPTGNSNCDASLGNSINPACVFHDVTLGDMVAPCVTAYDCFLDGATFGVLSLSTNAYVPAFSAATGWDFATGIGTVNVSNLVESFSYSHLLLGSRHRHAGK